MVKKFVVTGPTGAIGHSLLEECIANHVEVYAVCRPDSARIANVPDHELIHVVKTDLSELSSVAKKLPANCDVFYHLAWAGTFGEDIRNNMYLQTKNIKYTLDAVELAYKCGCHTFIGAGSQAEYGRFEGTLRPDTATFPDNGYGMAKLCAGQMSRVQAHKYGMKHIWTRILSVYGPYDGEKTMVMATIIKLLRRERPVFTKAEQIWDYLYSKDAGAMMFALAGENSVDGKIYCLGSGQAKPLKEYIKVIRNAVDHKLPLGIGELPYNDKQVMFLCADNSDILQDLAYQYRYSFEEGIRETIAWYKRKSGK